MKPTTLEYQRDINKPFRNKFVMEVSMGVVDQESQRNAIVTSDEFYFSATGNQLFNVVGITQPYATDEKDFTLVNNKMYWSPKPTDGRNYLYQGTVSNTLSDSNSNINEFVYITFKAEALPIYSIKGLTINFGTYYPIDFDIVYDNGSIEVRNNQNSEYISTVIFRDITFFKIIAKNMNVPYRRFRISKWIFGVLTLFQNNEISSATFKETISSISQELPSSTLSLKINNVNKEYNLDNQDSPIRFMQPGQELAINLGYELDDGSIEMIPQKSLILNDFDSDDEYLVMNAIDQLFFKNELFEKGLYHESGISYFDLAKEVFLDMNINEAQYIIAEELKSLVTKNPLPVLPHKECLQLIANATQCIMTETEQGYYVIERDTSRVANYMVPEYSYIKSNAKPKILEMIKNVTVPISTLSKDVATSETNIATQEILYNRVDWNTNRYRTVSFSNPSYDIKVLVNEVDVTNQLGFMGSYAVAIPLPTVPSDKGDLEPVICNVSIIGKNFIRSSSKVMLNINEKGLDKQNNNPLIDNTERAKEVALWVGIYYKSDKQYSFSWLGDPSIEINDIVRAYSPFVQDLKVRIISNEVTFDRGRFTSKVIARREQ